MTIKNILSRVRLHRRKKTDEKEILDELIRRAPAIFGNSEGAEFLELYKEYIGFNKSPFIMSDMNPVKTALYDGQRTFPRLVQELLEYQER